MLGDGSVGFRLLLVPSPGLYGFRRSGRYRRRLVYGGAGACVLCMATDIFRRLGVIGYGFHSRRLVIGCACARVPLVVAVRVCCLLVGSYAWECIGIYAIRCNCKEYYNFITVFCFRFRLGVAGCVGVKVNFLWQCEKVMILKKVTFDLMS